MRRIRRRLCFLMVLLIMAFAYRFPVEIQKIALEAKDGILSFFTARAPVEEPKKENTLAGNAAPVTENARRQSAVQGDRKKKSIVIIKLKNRGSIKGIIVGKGGGVIEVDIGGGGLVELNENDIKSIELPSEAVKARIVKEREKLGKDRDGEKIIAEIRYWDSRRIIVSATVNETLTVRLVLDTGAPYVVIVPKIAERALDTDKMIAKEVRMEWTDGRSTPGKLILLESLKVDKAYLENVKAVIADIPNLESDMDGLLGMSFLNNFHVKIDSGSKRIVLTEK